MRQAQQYARDEFQKEDERINNKMIWEIKLKKKKSDSNLIYAPLVYVIHLYTYILIEREYIKWNHA